MAEPTTARPGIDPVMKALLDAFPLTFTADEGVEVAREKLRQLREQVATGRTAVASERTADSFHAQGLSGAA